jgi:Ca2+-binding RTX toxin-like protein
MGTQINGTAYSDRLDVTGTNDTLVGNAGNDYIQGGAGDNLEIGGQGDDSFGGDGAGYTDPGNDTIQGGDGNDYIRSQSGADTFDGGAGNDRVTYYSVGHGIDVNMVTGVVADGSGDNDLLINVEMVSGSNGFADVMLGSDGANTFYGNGGDDTLDGGAGIDTVGYQFASAGVTVNLADGASIGADGVDQLSNFENIEGSYYNDMLSGDAGANVLLGLGGADTLAGGGGNDTLRGGGGDDLAVFSGNRADYAISTEANGDLIVTDLRDGSPDGVDRLSGIRNLQFDDETISLQPLERVVSSNPANLQVYQATTQLAAGGYVVAYRDFDSGGDGIVVRQFDAEGQPVGAEQRVNSVEPGDQRGPSVGALDDGGYVVVWNSNNNPVLSGAPSWDIKLQRFDSAGNKVDGEVLVNTTTAYQQRFPTATGLGDYGYIVTWQSGQDGGGTSNGIYAQKYYWDGSKNGGEFQLNTTTDGPQEAQMIERLSDGSLVVVWRSVSLANQASYVMQHLDVNGNKTGAETMIIDCVNDYVGNIHISQLSTGGFVVTWTATPPGGTVQVLARAFSASGEPVGEGPLVVANGANYHSASDVQGLDDGSFMVVWDNQDDSGGSSIMVRRYDGATQDALTDNLVVSDHLGYGAKTYPTLATSGDGSIVVSWSAQGGVLTKGGGIFQQLIDKDGNAEFVVGSTSATAPAAPAFSVQTIVGGNMPQYDPAYFSAQFMLLNSPLSSGATVGNSHLALQGTAALGSVIKIYEGVTLLATVGVNDDGRWGAEIEHLNDGAHALTATVTDVYGHTSAKSAAFNLMVSSAVLNGTAGADGEVYWGEQGASDMAQTLNGNAGNDTLNGGGGKDTLVGGAGDDTYVVGQTDVVVTEAASAGTDTIKTSVDFTLSANVENGVLTASGHTLTGNATANQLTGTSGNDSLNGGAGNDTLTGLSGNDTYTVDAAGDVVVEEFSSGVDLVNVAYTAAGTYALGANVENATVTSTVAINLTGNALDNVLTGNAAANKLEGGAGNDTLDGKGGNDTMTGGAGADVYYVDATTDVIIETELNVADQVYVTAASYTLSANVENMMFQGSGNFTGTGNDGNNTLLTGAGDDKLSGMGGNDLLVGGGGKDTLLGGAGADTLIGGPGNDSIDGGTITDLVNETDMNTVVYKSSAGGVNVNLETGLAQDGFGGSDTLVNINAVVGSNFADVLTGRASAIVEQFDGGSGNDTIDGGAVVDPQDRGYVNRVTYQNETQAVTVDLDQGTANGATIGEDTLININAVRGSDSGDHLSGSDRDGVEIFEGRGGNDIIDGREGYDIASYENAHAGVVVDLLNGTAEDGDGGVDELSGIEGVRGSIYNDVLTGGNPDNGESPEDDKIETFQGNGGNDSIDGGVGLDIAIYTSSTAGIVANLATGVVVDGLGGTDQLTDIEGLIGSAFADVMNGSDARVEFFEGRDGNDTIDGKGGDDYVDYEHTGGAVKVTLGIGSAAGTASDGYGGTDTLRNIEHVSGGKFNDSITGNEADNQLDGGEGDNTLSGGAGNDWLEAGNGNDSMLGGTGDDNFRAHGGKNFVDGGPDPDNMDVDILVVDGVREDYVVTRLDNGDTKLVNTHSDEQVIFRNVEWIEFSDGLMDLETLVGGSAGPGADTIWGSGLDDTLDGAGGADEMIGFTGNDTYIVDNVGDILIEDEDLEDMEPVNGLDTVQVTLAAAGTYNMLTNAANVENAIAAPGTVAINLIGNDSDNKLTGNAAGNKLTGGLGNDTLDGGAGNDTMDGGQGNDNYYVDSATDTVTEAANGGIDSIITMLTTYTLGATLENLQYIGSAAFTGTGNAGNNVLLSGSGNDKLDGKEGNDLLVGGQGSDSLLGGAGSDTLVGGPGNDTLDGGALTDKINNSDFNIAVYSNGANSVSVDLSTGVASDGFGGSDKLVNINFVIGSDHDDVLTGSNLAQLEGFEGGAGNDTIDGGEVRDYARQSDNNMVMFLKSDTGVTVNLQEHMAIGEGSGVDTLLNITMVRGSTHDDSITGSDSDLIESFSGEAGDDTIDGGGGIDFASYDFASHGVTVDLGAGTASDGEVDEFENMGTDTLINIEGVRGSAHDDLLMSGGMDFAIFIGNGGNDTIEGDSVYWDIVEYNTSKAGVKVDLAAGTATDGLGGTDELHGIEEVHGSAFNDTIIGSDGSQWFEGEAGNDSIDGADGVDGVMFNRAGSAVVVNLATGTATDGDGGTDKLFNIESASGTNYADILTGSAADNMLSGRYGNDTLDGGAGNDTLYGDEGNNSMLGGLGDDQLISNGARDTVDGGAGDDEVILALKFEDYTITRPNAIDTVLTNKGNPDNVITVRGVETFRFGGADGTTMTAAEVQLNIASVGPDNLLGTDDNDDLNGGAGNDTMTGLDGDDTYTVDNALDLIIEDVDGGDDLVKVAFTAAGTFDMAAKAQNVEDATVTAAATIALNVIGNALDNKLTGNAAANKLSGGAGDDTLDGGAGNDTMDGGLGDDSYVVDAAGDVVTELANGGWDGVKTTLGTYTLGANVELVQYVGSGNFIGTGNADANVLVGGIRNDKLDGMAGTDLLVGGNGNDTLLGGAGSDELQGGYGNDSIDGGAILDKIGNTDANYVNYGESLFGVDVNLATGIAQDGMEGTDKLVNINFVIGSTHNDILTGSTAALLEGFEGGEGDDVINGGAVTDTINQTNNNVALYHHSASAVAIDLEAGTADGESSGHDTLINITIVRGSTHDDTITGSDSVLTEILSGEGGNDTIDGGGGMDIVSYDFASGAVNVQLGGSGEGTAQDGDGGTDTLIDIDGVRGSRNNDTLTGSDDDVTENFMGNAGNDLIDGGDGLDGVDYSTSANGVNVNLGSGVALDGLGGTDTLSNIEQVRGSAFNDTLTGSDTADSFEGRGGNDTIDGKGGNDTVDYYASAGAVSVNLATGIVANDGMGGADKLAGIEIVIGSSFGDTLIGSAGADTLDGGLGNDTLDGGAGADILIGGAGNNSITGGAGADILFSQGGKDVLDGGLDGDTAILALDFSAYTVSRPNATDTVLTNKSDPNNIITVRGVETFKFGGLIATPMTLAEVQANITSAFDDNLVGDSGANTLNGGLGNDRMEGKGGNDTYVVNAAGDNVVEAEDEGIDSVTVDFTAAGTYAMSANVENATITGALAVNVTGNAMDNVLTGNSAANKLDGDLGNDSISGGLGNDTITGGAGNDTIDGGAGSDSMAGGAGNDIYTVDAAADVVTEASGVGSGDDAVLTSLTSYTLGANVESLQYTGTLGFAGTGNVLDNLILGGVGNDVLKGLAGNDTLMSGAGNDSLDGGEGNDAFAVGTGVDTVDGGAGTDTLTLTGNFADFSRTRLSVTDTLLVNAVSGESVLVRGVESFFFNGVAKTLAQVNENRASTGDDVLTGRVDFNDTLDGGLGADNMTGYSGDDTYVVNVAGDVVVEASGEGTDNVLVAFTAVGTYALSANVENATVTGTLAVNVTGNGEDNILIGNTAANKLDGGAGSDSISGGLGNDTVTGGAGNDTIDGGAGTDSMSGGDGDDVYTVDVATDVVTELATGGSGTDQILTTAAALTLALNVENLKYTGSAAFAGTGNASANVIEGAVGNDKLLGMAGADSLVGNAGNDTLDGGADNDTLAGGSGNDSLIGGDGNDALNAGTGVDVADGGGGSGDTLTLLGNFDDFARTRLSLTDTQLINVITGENVVVRGVENFVFNGVGKTLDEINANRATIGNDTLTGAADQNDTLDGGLGIDSMTGYSGDDTYVVNVAGDVVVEASGEGMDSVTVAFTAAGTYVLSANVENATVTGALAVNVTGNAENNALTGNTAANKLEGGAGNDSLNGGAGNDTMIGGDGDDVYVVDVATDVVTELATGGSGTDLILTTAAALTLALNVENLKYTGLAAFAGTGNASANVIEGAVGNDKLLGMAGADSLVGNAGNDTLDGGADNDTLSGGIGNDSLIGGDGNDALNVGTGIDVADGGAGSDTLTVLGAFGSYTVTRLSATDTQLVNAVTGENITLRGVETVNFDGGDKSIADINGLLGSPGNDSITGTGGSDTLDGGLGIDTLVGGSGNDTYVVNVAGDLVVEQFSSGVDNVLVAFTAVGSYTLADNIEDATITGTLAVGLTGNNQANTLTGNSAANKLDGGGESDALYGGAGNDTLIGGTGNDTLDGGLGNDSMTGGAGSDTYYVNSATDVVVETVVGDLDWVITTLNTYTMAKQIELVSFQGTGAFTGTGNELGNVMIGGAGNDTLSGGAGEDDLIGAGGNNRYTGGAGNDWFYLSSGSVNTVTDFVAGTDHVILDMPSLEIGNGDGEVDLATTRSAAGGFDVGAELVVFTQNAAGTGAVSAGAAAALIGSANTAYATGAKAVFVVDNGTSSTVFLFTSGADDELVSEGELTQLAVLTGTPATTVADYEFYVPMA